jgi:pimeloyl-ACP methyl ester carboxylesterase
MATARVPLLLLPGLLCDAELFAPQVTSLGDVADARVADLTAHDTMAALAADAIARAPWPRFAVGALSMGGYVAYEIMRQAPERVLALALMDTSARPDTPEASENRRRLITLAGRDFPAVIETLLPKLMTAAHVADPGKAGIVRAMAKRIGREAFVRQERAIIGRVDSRPDLTRIACPTVVIAGADDQLMPREIHAEQADAIRGAELVIVDDCGHLSSLEQPQRVGAALRRWLTSGRSPA